MTSHRVWRLGADVDTDALAPGHAMKHGFEAMPGDDVDAVLHRMARRQCIGVDVGAEAPDAMGHASTSRGSVTHPRSADAATV